MVVTEAFGGEWQEKTVDFKGHGSLTWGRDACVVMAWNSQALPAKIQGAKLAAAFLQTAIATANSRHGVCLGTSRWTGSSDKFSIYVARSDAFDGVIDFPYKRHINPMLPLNLTTEDPATNEFAAHLARSQFDEAAVHAPGGVNGPITKLSEARSEPKAHRLNRRIPVLVGCDDVENQHGGSFSQACRCYDTSLPIPREKYEVTCHGNEAKSDKWSSKILLDAVDILRHQLNVLNRLGWGSTQVVGSLYSGATMFTPKNYINHPTNSQSDCCRLHP